MGRLNQEVSFLLYDKSLKCYLSEYEIHSTGIHNYDDVLN